MSGDLEDFVHVTNVSRFLRILASDIDPARRRVMRDLLLEEEAKLGKTVEQLNNASRWIDEGRTRIERVRRAASDSNHAIEHRRQAESILVTLQQTQLLLEQFHDHLNQHLNHTAL